MNMPLSASTTAQLKGMLDAALALKLGYDHADTEQWWAERIAREANETLIRQIEQELKVRREAEEAAR
jgi:hypothetical protein